jgi:MFS family permease
LTTTASRARLVAVLGIGVFIGAVDLTVATTMLRQIIGDLEIPLPEGFDRAAWIVNAYVVAYVSVMPLAGRLSDLWGRRRVLLVALTVFAVGSTLAPFTTTLGPFVAARVLAAVGGGAIVPVALAAVGDLYRERGRGRALGILGATETLGWVCGPLLGALLVRFAHWKWHFAIMVPLALVALPLTARALRALGPPAVRRRLDLLGALALSTLLVALTAGLLEIGEIASATDLAGLGHEGGTPVWPYFLVAAVAGTVFAVTQRRSPDPIVDPALLRPRNVAPALGVNLLVGAVLAVAMVNVPFFVNLVVETELRRAAVVSGLVLTALTATMAAAAPIGGWLADRVSYRRPVVAGMALAVVGLALMGSSWDQGVTAATMAPHLAVLGVGLGLVTAPLTAAVVDAVTAARRGVAASFVLIARLVGVSLGLAGLTAWAITRFDTLRRGLDLPPITDPGYAAAVEEAQRNITATVLGETFLVSAALAGLALLVAAAFLRPAQPAEGP